MEELKVKKDFTTISTQKFPNSYLKKMTKLDYLISDKTEILYMSLTNQPIVISKYLKNQLQVTTFLIVL